MKLHDDDYRSEWLGYGRRSTREEPDEKVESLWSSVLGYVGMT
jgi:hypothetical protein